MLVWSKQGIGVVGCVMYHSAQWWVCRCGCTSGVSLLFVVGYVLGMDSCNGPAARKCQAWTVQYRLPLVLQGSSAVLKSTPPGLLKRLCTTGL